METVASMILTHTHADEALSERLEAVQPTNFFVVDDDPLFRRAIQRAAKMQGITVAIYDPDVDFYDLPQDGVFDVGIIDFNLGSLRGTQVSALYRETPVLLISAEPHAVFDDKLWPNCIRAYSSKNRGMDSILQKALMLCADRQRPASVA